MSEMILNASSRSDDPIVFEQGFDTAHDDNSCAAYGDYGDDSSCTHGRIIDAALPTTGRVTTGEW